MPTAELIIRSGGMVAVIAGDAVAWRCMFCRTAQKPKQTAAGVFAALAAMAEHMRADHPDLLTTADRAHPPDGGT